VTGTIQGIVERPGDEGKAPHRFAFVKPDDGGKDRMFMPSHLDPSVRWEMLRQGDRVEYVEVLHPKGLRASQVKLAVVVA
jgi:cold shock CspA family protein